MYKVIESALRAYRQVLIDEADLNNDYEERIDEVTILSEKIETVLPHAINFLKDYYDELEDCKSGDRGGKADDVWNIIQDLQELREEK